VSVGFTNVRLEKFQLHVFVSRYSTEGEDGVEKVGDVVEFNTFDMGGEDH
jgi:hypothetical protein